MQQVRNCATWQLVDDDWFTQVSVIVTLGRECREWTEEAVNLEIDSLIEENSLSDKNTKICIFFWS